MTPWLDERIAANGKAVRENFFDWFCDSQVVDHKGRPLIVYHGTASDFDVFKPGAYFTVCSEQAGHYASNQAEASGSKRSIAVYLNLQNPKIVDDDYIEWAGMCGVERGKLEGQGFDGMMNMAKTEIVVFSPKSIKSAPGNSGLYLKESASLTDAFDLSAALELKRSGEALKAIPNTMRCLAEALP